MSPKIARTTFPLLLCVSYAYTAFVPPTRLDVPVILSSGGRPMLGVGMVSVQFVCIVSVAHPRFRPTGYLRRRFYSELQLHAFNEHGILFRREQRLQWMQFRSNVSPFKSNRLIRSASPRGWKGDGLDRQGCDHFPLLQCIKLGEQHTLITRHIDPVFVRVRTRTSRGTH